MSPTAFKQQLTYLLSTLTTCQTLCSTIRTNRRLASTNALDSLEDTISTSHPAILSTYTTLRKRHGSVFDQGDNLALNILNKIITEVQQDIEDRLDGLAHKKKEKGEGEKKPGFGEMDRKIVGIVGEVVDILEGFGQRIERYEREQQQQAQLQSQPEKKPQQQQKKSSSRKSDEVVLSLRELDAFVQHQKNCWVEKNVAGKILYINVFDDKVTQWERPSSDAFIRCLPEKKRVNKVKTWEAEEAEAEMRRKEKKERRENEAREKELVEKLEREIREKEKRAREVRELKAREQERKELEAREWEWRRDQVAQQQAIRDQQLREEQQQRDQRFGGGRRQNFRDDSGRGW